MDQWGEKRKRAREEGMRWEISDSLLRMKHDWNGNLFGCKRERGGGRVRMLFAYEMRSRLACMFSKCRQNPDGERSERGCWFQGKDLLH